MGTKENKKSTLTEYREVLEIMKQNQDKENWLKDKEVKIEKLIKDGQLYWRKYKKCVDDNRCELGEYYKEDAINKLNEANNNCDIAIDFVLRIPKYLADTDIKSALVTKYIRYKSSIESLLKVLNTYKYRDTSKTKIS